MMSNGYVLPAGVGAIGLDEEDGAADIAGPSAEFFDDFGELAQQGTL